MPIYAYKCGSCGFAQDEMQRVSDTQLSVCPTCGQSTYAKQVTAPNFALKGTGWYATDFKGGAKPAEKSVESATVAKPEPAVPASAKPAIPAIN